MSDFAAQAKCNDKVDCKSGECCDESIDCSTSEACRKATAVRRVLRKATKKRLKLDWQMLRLIMKLPHSISWSSFWDLLKSAAPLQLTSRQRFGNV